MTIELPPLADAYVLSVNTHDAAAYSRLFDENAVVNDNGRELRGRKAIEAWADTDIFAAKVTFDVLNASQQDGETVITTKVDGDFDRTGLPDPVVIDHHIKTRGEKIVGLTCRLAGGQ